MTHAVDRTLPLALLATLMWMASHAVCAHERDTAARTFGDDIFMAGSDVDLSAGSRGDAVLAGAWLASSGEVQGDEVATGGRVNMGSNVAGGLYAAGGRVRLDGKVGHNARVAGGRVVVSPQAEVQGGLTIGAGQVDMDGRVGKYLQVGAGRTRIDGQVAGNVDVASGELSIGPDAVIDGVLTYYGPQPATIAPGAQIRGGTHYVERRDWHRPGHRHGFGPASWFWLIGWIIAGSVVLALWPNFSRLVSDAELHRPGTALLLGFAVLVCVPVALLLLTVSIVGIPLALLLLFLYLVLLPLGYLASAAAIGDWLLPRVYSGTQNRVRQRIVMLIGVLVVLFLLTRVPVLGGMLSFLLVAAGVGSLVLAGGARRRSTEAPASSAPGQAAP